MVRDLIKNPCVRTWAGRINPWLIALPALGAIVVLLAFQIAGFETKRSKAVLEVLGIGLSAVATAILAYRVYRGHGPLYQILLFLAASLLYREIHPEFPDWSGKVIFVCLPLAGIWAWRWWDRIRPELESGPIFSWLFATLSMYFLSQVIARRLFRGLPYEQAIHVGAEELLEVIAHTFLVITSMLGPWQVYRRQEAAKTQAKPDTVSASPRPEEGPRTG